LLHGNCAAAGHELQSVHDRFACLLVHVRRILSSE
jgi:hypothetical protein